MAMAGFANVSRDTIHRNTSELIRGVRSPKGRPADSHKLPYFFRHLGERVLLQFLCVAVEFADTFGQLFCRHSIFVVHPAESFLAEAQALVLARLGRGRV